MFERFMRWLGWVPIALYDKARASEDFIFELNSEKLELLNRLRQYAPVREIEANIDNGTARKK